MISESINFMILGMSTVFSFLVIMILVLKIQSYLIGKISFDDSSVGTSDLSSKSNRGVDQKKIAVISAAIKQHENNKK